MPYTLFMLTGVLVVKLYQMDTAIQILLSSDIEYVNNAMIQGQ